MKKTEILSGNAIKIIAAIAMLIDHIGYIFFPNIEMLRIIGRISFPLFAFMIAQGCKYTKNKRKYFFLVFGLAVVCQVVYYIFTKDTYLSVLFSFSIAILLIYSLQFLKKNLKTNVSLFKKSLGVILFILLIFLVVLINKIFTIDYGFWGCLLPVFASLFDGIENATLKKWITLISFALGICLMAFTVGGNQWFSLIALIPLLFYSRQRGKFNLKYFFYIFYPLHLAVLYGISMLI